MSSANERYSVLMLKPETIRLPNCDKDTVIASLMSRIVNRIIGVTDLTIPYDGAKNLWQADIGKYPWVEEYYKHMCSGLVYIYLVEGPEQGREVKKGIRSEHGALIHRLNEQYKTPFELDLIHGSDEGRVSNEIEHLGLKHIVPSS